MGIHDFCILTCQNDSLRMLTACDCFLLEDANWLQNRRAGVFLTADHINSFVQEQSGMFCCIIANRWYDLGWIVVRCARELLLQPCMEEFSRLLYLAELTARRILVCRCQYYANTLL